MSIKQKARWAKKKSTSTALCLSSKKLPQGAAYPQLTQAPLNNYAEFLNFFRGGHTIDTI